jgi:aryl-alcohol dehydrogenase-like predicted oxidoreductase
MRIDEIASHELRKLGQTEIFLSPIGLGCWQFSKGRGLTGRYWKSLADEEINQIVEESHRGGINWFDSAEAYGFGESERALRRAIDEVVQDREDIIIATKWWPLLRSSRSLLNSIDERLDALGVSIIDLYQIHHPYSFSSTQSEMRAMIRLVESGKIRAIGLSNYSAKAMRDAHKELSKHGLTLASNQVEYSLLNRKIEKNGILDTARELGISIIAYSPLAQGLLTGRFHKDPTQIYQVRAFRRIFWTITQKKIEQSRDIIQVLQRLAVKYEVTLAQIAINWVINTQGNQVVAIAGASSKEQAHENVQSMNFELSEEDIHSLNEVSTRFAQ